MGSFLPRLSLPATYTKNRTARAGWALGRGYRMGLFWTCHKLVTLFISPPVGKEPVSEITPLCTYRLVWVASLIPRPCFCFSFVFTIIHRSRLLLKQNLERILVTSMCSKLTKIWFYFWVTARHWQIFSLCRDWCKQCSPSPVNSQALPGSHMPAWEQG